MYCFVILLLFNEMQMSVRRFSAIPHLREIILFEKRFAFSFSRGFSSVPRWLAGLTE